MKPLVGGGQKPADMKPVDRIRSRLGMVFQSFNLWTHMTVLENVIEAPVHVLGVPKREAIEKAEALLDKVGIADKRNPMPTISPASSNSVAPSSASARHGPEVCCSTSRHRPSTRNWSERCCW